MANLPSGWEKVSDVDKSLMSPGTFALKYEYKFPSEDDLKIGARLTDSGIYLILVHQYGYEEYVGDAETKKEAKKMINKWIEKHPNGQVNWD